MEEKDNTKTLVTAALPYANGELHIGHIAGNILPADIYVRFLRKKKKNVIFICGSDEHGVPISISARKKGVSPQQIIDEYHLLNKKNLEDFGISFDIFSRTSNDIHKEMAKDFFLELYKKGELIEKENEQYYDEKEKQFLADRYIRGTCPKCGYNDAYGDQCEKCGITLSPGELINPHSFLSGEKPVLKKTKHWFLPLSKYQSWVENWILKEHTNWKTNVYEQCRAWLKEGLLDRPITRDLDWGIRVPLPEAEGKVLYVWFDAPIGYISFTKELLGEEYKDWWEDNNTRLIHFLGKDNIVFHCIIFPIMLKSHGKYILPDVVCGNEFINLEGEKISKSREHAVWLKEYLEQYPNQQDVLRYVLCANMPESKDSNFTWEDFKRRNNNELVATLGNFINRSISMMEQYFKEENISNIKIKEEKDLICLNEVNKEINEIENNIENFKFKEGLKCLMKITKLGNKFIDDNKPWAENKVNKERTKEILNVCIQIICKLGIVCEPFLPFTSKKIIKMLELEKTNWEDGYRNDLFQEGMKIKEKEFLFKKIE